MNPWCKHVNGVKVCRGDWTEFGVSVTFPSRGHFIFVFHHNWKPLNLSNMTQYTLLVTLKPDSKPWCFYAFYLMSDNSNKT